MDLGSNFFERSQGLRRKAQRRSKWKKGEEHVFLYPRLKQTILKNYQPSRSIRRLSTLLTAFLIFCLSCFQCIREKTHLFLNIQTILTLTSPFILSLVWALECWSYMLNLYPSCRKLKFTIAKQYFIIHRTTRIQQPNINIMIKNKLVHNMIE